MDSTFSEEIDSFKDGNSGGSKGGNEDGSEGGKVGVDVNERDEGIFVVVDEERHGRVV